MLYPLLMLAILLVILAVLLGLSIGVAFLLQWLLPAVTMDTALLIAVLAVGFAMLCFACITVAGLLRRELLDAEEETQARPIVILDPDVPPLPRSRRKRG